MHTFIIAAESAAAEYLVVTLLGALSILLMKILASNKKDVQYATLAVTLIKDTLGEKLGPKADAVLSVWEDGLKAIQDGKFNDQEMVDEFVKFVKAAVLLKHSVQLSPSEVTAVRTAAITTIKFNSVKATPTKMAVKAMMVEPSVRAMNVQAMVLSLQSKNVKNS